MIPYLEAEDVVSAPLPPPPSRCALVQFYLNSIESFWEAKVNLDTQTMFNRENLVGRHSYTDAVEMQETETACLADPRVQAEIKAMDLPEDAVVCIEPWTYAPDGMEDMMKRRIMVCLPRPASYIRPSLSSYSVTSTCESARISTQITLLIPWISVPRCLETGKS